MSTRTTKASTDAQGLHVHLYHEMHDDCIHFTLSGPSYSAIDIIIPSWMVPGLIEILERR